MHAAYVNLSGMKVPTSDDELNSCEIMSEVPTRDLIIVQYFKICFLLFFKET